MIAGKNLDVKENYFEYSDDRPIIAVNPSSDVPTEREMKDKQIRQLSSLFTSAKSLRQDINGIVGVEGLLSEPTTQKEVKVILSEFRDNKSVKIPPDAAPSSGSFHPLRTYLQGNSKIDNFKLLKLIADELELIEFKVRDATIGNRKIEDLQKLNMLVDELSSNFDSLKGIYDLYHKNIEALKTSLTQFL